MGGYQAVGGAAALLLLHPHHCPHVPLLRSRSRRHLHPSIMWGRKLDGYKNWFGQVHDKSLLKKSYCFTNTHAYPITIKMTVGQLEYMFQQNTCANPWICARWIIKKTFILKKKALIEVNTPRRWAQKPKRCGCFRRCTSNPAN